MKNYLKTTAILIAGLTFMFHSCSKNDENPIDKLVGDYSGALDIKTDKQLTILNESLPQEISIPDMTCTAFKNGNNIKITTNSITEFGGAKMAIEADNISESNGIITYNIPAQTFPLTASMSGLTATVATLKITGGSGTYTISNKTAVMNLSGSITLATVAGGGSSGFSMSYTGIKQ